jgi:hypothetical protein
MLFGSDRLLRLVQPANIVRRFTSRVRRSTCTIRRVCSAGISKRTRTSVLRTVEHRSKRCCSTQPSTGLRAVRLPSDTWNVVDDARMRLSAHAIRRAAAALNEHGTSPPRREPMSGMEAVMKLDQNDRPFYFSRTASRASASVPIPSRAWVKSAQPPSASNDEWNWDTWAQSPHNISAPSAAAESAARLEPGRDRRREAHRPAPLDCNDPGTGKFQRARAAADAARPVACANRAPLSLGTSRRPRGRSAYAGLADE